MTLEMLFLLSDVGCFFKYCSASRHFRKESNQCCEDLNTASPARKVFSAYIETQGERGQECPILPYPGC